MPRPIWQGYLRLSLVTCPVALYTATNRAYDVSFHLLHKKTHSRIRMIPHDPKLGAVERSDLVKGYELEKDKYVIVTAEELQAVKLESTKTIEISEFVEVADIDRIYWKEPYYLVPTGKAGAEAFSVIREAMRASGKIGLGRIVLSSRERVIALEPRDKGMLVTTLRSNDEVRSPDDVFESIPETKKPDRKMLDIADKIIEQELGEFDPSHFKDRYEAALRDIIRRKERGQPVTARRPATEDGKVVDLMDALKRSLEAKKTGRGGKPGKTNVIPMGDHPGKRTSARH